MNVYLLLVTCYLLLFLFLAIKNLKTALFLTIFSLPAYQIRFNLGPLPMTVLEVNILLVFLVWLIKSFKHFNILTFKQNLRENLFLYFCIFIFLLSATISMFISPDLRAAAGLWKVYFLEPILFLIVFVSIIKQKDLDKVFKWLGASAILLSLFAIYQKISGAFISNPFWAAESTRRVTSVFPYPNALALFLTPILIILIGLFVQKYKNASPRRYQVLFFATFLLTTSLFGILAIYFTKSKGALLALLAGIIFYTLFYKGHRKIFTTILIITIITFITIITINPAFIKGTASVEGGDSISTRLEMWSEAWQMLKTKPLLGAGLAGYQTAVVSFHTKDYIEVYLYPHNIFLNFWTEIGLLGLLAFIGIIIWFYKTGFFCHPVLDTGSRGQKNVLDPGFRRDDKMVVLMSAMTALLVHGLVDVPYFKNDLAILFWLLISLMIISRRGGRAAEGATLEKS